MLESLGDLTICRTANGSSFECCDRCSPSALTLPPYSRLAILVQGVASSRKRRRAVRTVDRDALRDKLVTTRDNFLAQRSDFCMVGVGFVCADSVIDKLCDEAKYIETIEDIPAELFGIRSELKLSFFFVICDTCSLIHHCTQRRRLK